MAGENQNRVPPCTRCDGENNLKTVKGAILLLLLVIIVQGGVSAATEHRQPKRYTVQILTRLSHSTGNFTQGLIYHDGKLYESTGIAGESTIQRIDVISGEVENILYNPPEVFAEGLALLGQQMFQLTWRHKLVYVYDFERLFETDFSQVNMFHYPVPITHGWGLTAHQSELIMSDGSRYLYFLDPDSFGIKRRIQVTEGGQPVLNINELEYARDTIYANVLYRNDIIQIDPTSGQVLAVIDASELLKQRPDNPEEEFPGENVLNGIAYNQTTDTFYVTGKRWPYIFEVQFIAHESVVRAIEAFMADAPKALCTCTHPAMKCDPVSQERRWKGSPFGEETVIVWQYERSPVTGMGESCMADNSFEGFPFRMVD